MASEGLDRGAYLPSMVTDTPSDTPVRTPVAIPAVDDRRYLPWVLPTVIATLGDALADLRLIRDDIGRHGEAKVQGPLGEDVTLTGRDLSQAITELEGVVLRLRHGSPR